MAWIPRLKSSNKSNGILIIPSKLHTNVFRCVVSHTHMFSKKKRSTHPGKPKIRRRSPVSAGLGAEICALAAVRVKIWKDWFFVLCLHFIRIHQITGGFTSKLDCATSSEIHFVCSLVQKGPKLRSRNPYNYKLKWTETDIWPEVRSDCHIFRHWKVTASWKWHCSKYAIFPGCQV